MDILCDSLSRVFAALADPTRRALLQELCRGPRTVGELSAPFRISEPAIIKHLAVLERAGLVSAGRDRQRRPRKLEAAPLKEAVGWLIDFRQFWEESFDQLDLLLQQLQQGEHSS